MEQPARSSQGPGDGSRSVPLSTPPRLDEDDLCQQVRAYLECRSHNLEPQAALAAAWDRFYDLYMPRIRAYLRRFHLSEADREDCLQEVWSKVLTRPAALPDDPRRARPGPG